MNLSPSANFFNRLTEEKRRLFTADEVERLVGKEPRLWNGLFEVLSVSILSAIVSIYVLSHSRVVHESYAAGLFFGMSSAALAFRFFRNRRERHAWKRAMEKFHRISISS
jgi:hypothetical protein